MDLSFSGAGFMGCYYFGVVNCWNKYIPRERVRRVAGASAGSLVAAYYLMDLPMSECLRAIIETTEDIRKRPLGVFDRSNQIVDILPRMLHKLLPEDAHKRVTGRLFVSMTRLKDMKSVIVSEFETKQDLVDALNCSCFIPVWSGNHVSTYKGVKHIDGGFTNNLPVFDEHTIRISSFSGPSDISPYDRHQLLRGSLQGLHVYLNWKNLIRARRALWPPPASVIIGILEQGFHDAKQFILTNDLIQCSPCFGQLEQDYEPIYTRLKNPTISPAVSPAITRASSYINLDNSQRGSSFKFDTPGPASSSWPPDHNSNQERRRDNNSIASDETHDSEASSANSSGIFSNEDAETNNGRPTSASTSTGSRSLSATLRAKLSALASRPKTSRRRQSSVAESAQESDLCNDRAQPVAPSIVVHAPDERKSPDSANDSSVSSPPPPPPPLVGAGQPTKMRRADARPRRESMPATGVSPINRFVRRMSLATEEPEQQQDDAQNRATSAISSNLLLNTDRFAMAPSPLPSCPPSPNLNRHCSECIRMRQQARADLIDEEIVEQAEIYRNLNTSDEPEKEFARLAAGGGIKRRLSGWLRSITGQNKHREYSFIAGDDEYSKQFSEIQIMS